MLVFKAFWKIIKKNIWALLLYLIIFMTIALLITGSGSDPAVQVFSQEKVPVAVIDNDNSAVSGAVKEYMNRTQTLVEIENDKDKIQDALFFRKIQYLITIPKGFSDKFISGEETNLDTTKVPKSYAGIYIDMQVEQFMKTMKAYITSGKSVEEAMTAAVENVEIESKVNMLLDDGTLVKEQDFSFYFRYLVYLFMAVLVQIIGTVFIAFNKEDVSRRMKCSSTTVKSKNLQLGLGCIIITAALWIIVWLMAILLYGGAINDSNMMPYIMVNTAVLSIVCTCVAFLVGTIAKTADHLTIIATTASLAMCFLSGVFVGLDVMSSTSLQIAKFLPSYWYVKNNEILGVSTSLSSSQLTEFWQSVGIQMIFAIAIFVISMIISKKRSGKAA